ncbi:MAG: UDP-glucose/GDP-mannose dehydrogenase family protein, partial [Candidatus Parvarchaeota archaeon]
ISFFGLGYVGLTMAACFASRGFDVIGYDVDNSKVKMLKEKKAPIFEPGIAKLIAESGDLLQATGDPTEAVAGSDFIFITTGTPSRDDGSIDIRYVEAAAKTIGSLLNTSGVYPVIVVKSTVVPGTTGGQIRNQLESASGRAAGDDFGLTMNPEFLKEGHAVEDMLKPDRLVIGEVNKKSGDALVSLYDDFYRHSLPPLVRTTLENAELIKYANNSFLALKISFANSIARLCEVIPGGDVDMIMKGIGLDSRIGNSFLRAGIAWGGSCFPKDLKAIRSFAKQKGVRLELVDASLEVNKEGPVQVVDRCASIMGGLSGKTVALLGLAFKPDTDDIRESPAIMVGVELIRRGATVKAFDPVIKSAPNGFILSSDIVECLRGADIALLATEWKEFQKIEPKLFASVMRTAVVMDTRRVYEREAFTAAGVRLFQLGRGEK